MFFWHDNIFTKYSRHLMFVSIVPYHVDIYFISLLFIMSCSCSLTCSPPPRPSSTPCPPPRPSRASSSPWPRSSWGPAPPRSLCASELCRRRCVYFIGLYLKELNLWSNVVFETMHIAYALGSDFVGSSKLKVLHCIVSHHPSVSYKMLSMFYSIFLAQVFLRSLSAL